MLKFGAFALVALAAAPAFAQDAGRAPFTGARVEGIGGWDQTQAYDDHKDGFLYGIGGGYDVQAGGLLVGIEGEASDSTTKTCAGGGTVADPRFCAKAGRDLYVGGRVGTVVAGGKALLYAKAGYTNGRYELSSRTGTGSTNVLDKSDLDGVRVGVGAEYALTPVTYVKAEYRYSNYERGVSRNQALAGFGIRF